MAPTDPWAKAGVMIRESLDSGSRNVFLALSASNGVAFQQRTAPLALTTSVPGPVVTAPYWVRVVRSGTNFTSYVSPNGTTWTPVGTTNISGFNATALWGLAVTARNNTLTNVTVFDNLTVVQSPVIAAISNQTLVAGQILQLTNNIVNPGTPPGTLTWSLLSAPTGMTLDSASGILNWRPTMAQSPSTNNIMLSVTASGTPPLNGTQQFSVYVLQPTTLVLSAPTMVNGVFSVSVNGNSGLDYMLQSATNLNPPVNWLTLQTNFSATPPFNFNDSNTSNCAAKFYRVQIGP